jgi:hypothetical protein
MRKTIFALAVTLIAGTSYAQPKADAGAAAPPAAPTTVAVGDAGATVVPPTVSGDGGLVAPPTTAAPVQTTQKSPPPPPPSKEQIAALQAMQNELEAYEKGARDYRDTVTSIIKLHYETKKKEILSGLDSEIATEKAELRKARDIAIRRLEEFIQTYSGPRAHPEATPDAMYRLAALYEERARSEEATDPLELGLKPAISLYKRVIVEYPKYRELAGIYYFLGHAYNDSGRIEEGQQVWRALVCKNHYKYPTPQDPKNPDKDTIVPLPQDNTQEYWQTWRMKYKDPKSIRKGNPETTFVDPYPQDCEGVAQPNLRPGEEPKYVGEVWWQIGNWEFDNLDNGGGVVPDEPAAVWDYNRAASAYQHSMVYKKPPLYGVALYKYAWTLFKQQRYEAATKEFVHLLLYTDEQQKLTGDPGADFRGEAYTYIAGSLTNLDFTGPGELDPYIQRPDIVDTEPRPDVAEKKLHVAVDRVKDPSLIPQDKPWTIEIYRALAAEFRSLNMFNNAIEVYEAMLKKWPMDPTAPDVQNAIAETYDQMNVTKRPGTPEHDAIAAKALEARTMLANYIGNTPWVDANKENPAALQNAERLVRGGLRQAAVAHTNNGKSQLVQASQTTDLNRQIEMLSRAQAEYKLAALGWQGYLKQDENAPDAYESRYWLADARHQSVRIGVVLHKLKKDVYPAPTRKELDEAKAAAVDVRDSNEDDKFLDNAAFFVVDVSDVDRDIEYQRFEDSKGTTGIEKREAVKFDSDNPETRKVIQEKIPPQVLGSIAARDEYRKLVPPSLDSTHKADEYEYYAAETYFLYGNFDEARARFEPMWRDHCGKDEYGWKAWEKLLTMSNIQRDAERSRQLAEAEKAHSCAVNAEQAQQSPNYVNPTIQEACFLDGRKLFEQACGAKIGSACVNPDAKERRPAWQAAAKKYQECLDAAPGRDEAPEAAMNSAYAYKQIGDYPKAIEMYQKFINDYGSEERLSKLEKGDPRTKTAPDPKKYQTRLKFLGDAYDALGGTYYGFFNYQKAAEIYEKIGANQRFTETKRKETARNAMILYANMGQKDKMLAMYRLSASLHPTADEKANADYLVADYEHKQWNPQGGAGGTNGQIRQQAEAALIGFYTANRNNPAAYKYDVDAAYAVAKMKQSAGDPGYHQWFKTTVDAWKTMRDKGPTGKDGKKEALAFPYPDYAAEADFTLLDEEIKQKYEAPDKHKYVGTVDDILGTYDAKTKALIKKGKYLNNADEAQKWDQKLEELARTYPSVEWVPAIIARQGTLFDTLRNGLYFIDNKTLKLFTPQQENILKQMENSGRDNLMDQAAELRTQKKELWRDKRDREIAASDEIMVRRYATALRLAQQYNVRNPYVARAGARLAYYTDIIGDAKMKEYVTKTKDPVNTSSNLDYKDGQYVQRRSGIAAVPPASGAVTPLPVAP